MTERHYQVGIGHLDGGPMQKRAAGNLAAAIIIDWTVRNIHVWENARSGVQHWREECPAGRRGHHGSTKLIPREVGLTKPCGHCALIEERAQRRREARRVRRVLALEPPTMLTPIEAAVDVFEETYRMAHLALPAGSVP